MERSCLNDGQWNKIADLLPAKPVIRRLVEAMLWTARTGAPWRDLPPSVGNENSVFQCFRRWKRF